MDLLYLSNSLNKTVQKYWKMGKNESQSENVGTMVTVVNLLITQQEIIYRTSICVYFHPMVSGYIIADYIFIFSKYY